MGKKSKRKRKTNKNIPLDLDKPDVRGREFEKIWRDQIWVPELKKKGFTEFHRPIDKETRGKYERGRYRGWPKKAFTHGSQGPDLIAINHLEKKILVGDITAGPWSQIDIKPGGRRKLPHGSGEIEKRPHLDKTIEDAQQLARHLPREFQDYEIVAQDRYRESHVEFSKEITVFKNGRFILPNKSDIDTNIGDRATSNKGTSEDNRGQQESNKETSDHETGKKSRGRQQIAKSEETDFGSSDIDSSKVKSGAGKRFLKFGGRLLIDQLIGMAVGLIIRYFESKVNDQNMLRLKTDWRAKIAPKIQPFIDHQIQKSLQGKFDDPGKNNQKYVYVELEWTLLLRELQEDASDVVVWFSKFLAGDPGFGEVYYGVRLDRVPTETHSPWHGNRAKDIQTQHRKKNINEYTYHQYVLVHDPFVLLLSKILRTSKRELIAKFDHILLEWHVTITHFFTPQSVEIVKEKLENYKFLSASNLMYELMGKMAKNSIVSVDKLKELARDTSKVNSSLRQLEKLTEKQRILLYSYLGAQIEAEVPQRGALGREFGRPGEFRGERPASRHTIQEPGKRFQ